MIDWKKNNHIEKEAPLNVFRVKKQKTKKKKTTQNAMVSDGISTLEGYVMPKPCL